MMAIIPETNHTLLFQPAHNLSTLDDESIDLVVTSPPYPMIEMWDAVFINQDSTIADYLAENKPQESFKRMHKILESVWLECNRLLKPGGIACINIGDAARTIHEQFRLFANHAQIIESFVNMGFSNLPNILWRKTTNAPTKFMGSGMYPPGAYVTLEHEYILIFRKGDKRLFKRAEDKLRRRQSAYFWEERNTWFSDLWNLKGVGQNMNDAATRKRSAAYPFELPYRLINMFSVFGDTVLDPFLGTGTTSLAALATARNSIGIEIDPTLKATVSENILNCQGNVNQRIEQRLQAHAAFVKKRNAEKGPDSLKYKNFYHDFAVVTRQETEARFFKVFKISQKDPELFCAQYSDLG